MITLKVNDIVFLEELGVHARVDEVMFAAAPAPQIEIYEGKYGMLCREVGQLERPKVVVTLVQVDV